MVLRRSAFVAAAFVLGGCVRAPLPPLPAPPPPKPSVSVSPSPKAVRVTLENPDYRIKVEVEPGGRGPNVLQMYAYTLQDKPLKVPQWTVTASAPGAEPVDVPILKLTDNHATGTLTLSTAGDWRLEVTAGRGPVTTTISVK